MSQRVWKELSAVSREKQKVWEDYHAGRINSSEMNRRTNVLEAKRQRLAEEARVPEYKDGDIVESKWGERAEIAGHYYSDATFPTLGYYVLRKSGSGDRIHDSWPAEVIVRKVGHAPHPLYRPHAVSSPSTLRRSGNMSTMHVTPARFDVFLKGRKLGTFDGPTEYQAKLTARLAFIAHHPSKAPPFVTDLRAIKVSSTDVRHERW